MKRALLAASILALLGGPLRALEKGSCEAKASGGLNLKVKGSIPSSDGKSTVGTDYWLSSLDAAAKGPESPLMLFIISCGDEDGMLTLQASPSSTRGQLPYRPGRYEVVKNGPKVPRGKFVAQVFVIKDDAPSLWEVASPGVLEITRFDASGIAGKVSFKAQDPGGKRSAQIEGAFDFPCVGDKCK